MRKIPVQNYDLLLKVGKLLREIEADMSGHIDKAKDYYEDRTQRWKDSGAASAYEEWMDDMETIKDLSADLAESIEALNDRPQE